MADHICTAGPMQWLSVASSRHIGPYHLDTPLSFVLFRDIHASGMGAMAGVEQTSDQLIANAE